MRKYFSAKIKKLLLIGLNMALVLFLTNSSQTFAYFADNESSNTNIFSAGTLDFNLSSADNFSPKITPTQNTLRTININNNGSLDFDYSIKSNSVSGDLCSSLNLSATLGAYNYAGPISGLNYSAGQFGTVGGNWQFEINLTSSDLSLQNKTCNFDFVFDGSQIGGAGFSDSETISNTVTSGYWSVVLNEFLPNPTGDDSALKPAGEWVEIYNNSSTAFDINGWYLYDAVGNGLLISAANSDNNGNLSDAGETVVPGSGFLVVYLDGAYNPGWLNNTGGDTLSLYDGALPGANLVDSYQYTVVAPEDKSFARIPDGTGAWVDPVPTPGKPNTLETAPELGGEAENSAPQEQSEESGQEQIQGEAISGQEATAQEEIAPDEDSTAGNNDSGEISSEDPVGTDVGTNGEQGEHEEQIVQQENNIQEQPQPTNEVVESSENSDSGSAEIAVQADNPVQTDDTAAADNIIAE